MPHVESDRPPPSRDAWVAEFQCLLPQWESLCDSSKVIIPISISRVNQFDAARLDVEMSAMLKEQLVKVFSLTKPGLLFQYQPELDAFLEFLIWRFSIWVDKPTPGNALMNLRYRDDRATPITGKEVRTGLEGSGLSVSQKILYCISTVGGQYIWSRLQSFSAFRRWGDSEQRPIARRVWGMVQHAEGLYRAVSFCNLLLFLYGRRRKGALSTSTSCQEDEEASTGLQETVYLQLASGALQLAHGPVETDIGLPPPSPGPCENGCEEANVSHAEQASPSPDPAGMVHQRDISRPSAKQLSSELGIDGFRGESQSSAASPRLEDEVGSVVHLHSRQEEVQRGVVW